MKSPETKFTSQFASIKHISWQGQFCILRNFIFSDLLAPSTKLEDKLEGIENFRAWKYRIDLILRENDLDKYINGGVVEPKEDEAKEKHKKDLIRAMRIITDFIKDHLIPQVSSKETPKEMNDALARMCEGRNININMNLRTQLKSTKICQGESIQDYFTRVS